MLPQKNDTISININDVELLCMYYKQFIYNTIKNVVSELATDKGSKKKKSLFSLPDFLGSFLVGSDASGMFGKIQSVLSNFDMQGFNDLIELMDKIDLAVKKDNFLELSLLMLNNKILWDLFPNIPMELKCYIIKTWEIDIPNKQEYYIDNMVEMVFNIDDFIDVLHECNFKFMKDIIFFVDKKYEQQ